MPRIILIDACWRCPYCSIGHCFMPEQKPQRALRDVHKIPSWCKLEKVKKVSKSK